MVFVPACFASNAPPVRSEEYLDSRFLVNDVLSIEFAIILVYVDYKYYYTSHLTKKFNGYSPLFLIGDDNLATATKSEPLYNPIVVI
jgi:hypothetical protein